jgi:uncharacterized protein
MASSIEALAAANAEEVPECTACGACCFSTLETYVKVSGSDYERVGDDAPHWITFDGHRAHLRMHDGHCAALQIAVVDHGVQAAPERSRAESPLPSPSAHFSCAIYPRRPETCRTLERGGPMCRAERELKTSRALAAASALERSGRDRSPH